ncbi:MAG: hypothetical protein WAJ93_24830, partial [Candidatus Nitrosopolaris sp.]
TISSRFLTTNISSLSEVSKSASSFGISIGLALLGIGLAKKYRKTRAARAIAKIFGTDLTVEALLSNVIPFAGSGLLGYAMDSR